MLCKRVVEQAELGAMQTLRGPSLGVPAGASGTSKIRQAVLVYAIARAVRTREWKYERPDCGRPVRACLSHSGCIVRLCCPRGRQRLSRAKRQSGQLRRRLRYSQQALVRLDEAPFFLFSLQTDSDSQVRRYSPGSGMKEAIARVMTSFARGAPVEMRPAARNYPLDSGRIRYDRFIRSFSEACGIEDRGLFVESGSSAAMLRKSRAVVRLNSAWACRRF